MQNKTIIIYHSTDFDGKCSGAIAKMNYPDATMYGYNHYQDINWDLIKQHNIVVMIDISFHDTCDMVYLNDNFSFIWIDHHISAIEKHGELGIAGIQRVGIGACALAWEYFFSDVDMPMAIELLAMYDVFDLSDAAFHFQYGMRREGIDIRDGDISPWISVFYDNDKFNQILSDGRICYEAEVESNKYKAKSAFYLDFHGYKAVAINSTPGSSIIFDSLDASKADIKIIFGYNGKKWIVTMYSEGAVNVGKIASSYPGGGGHMNAAGFKTDINTMVKLGLIA